MRKQEGFIGWVVLVIIALALLNYFFGWNIFDFAETREGRAVIDYTQRIVSFVWYYIKTPIIFLWEIVMDLFNQNPAPDIA